MGAGASASLIASAEGAVQTLRTGSESERINTLKNLKPNCDTDGYRFGLVDPQLGLAAELTRILRDSSGDEKILAAECLWYLSRGSKPKPVLGARSLGLMSIVAANIEMDACFCIAGNVILANECHDYCLSHEAGLVKYSLDNFSNTTRKLLPLRLIANMSSTLKQKDLNLFLSYSPVEIIMQSVSTLSATALSYEYGSLGFWVLNVISRLTFFPAIATEMKSFGVVSVLTQVMNTSSIAGVKATIAICNLIGKDEASKNEDSLLHKYPRKYQVLVELLKQTLAKSINGSYPEFSTYVYGMISMRSICGAIRTLSISDTNKPKMLESNVLTLIIRALKLFTENAPQLTALVDNKEEVAGGGGDDEDTAEAVIEALLQLSFNFEMDEKFRDVYTKAASDGNCNIIDILDECVADPRSKLSSECKRNASSLLKRLRPPPLKVEAPAVVQSVSTKHIMLSYSWAVNKNLVAAVGARLRELGHDVWRDEEGSRILGPMSGDTDEMMAAAIEQSHAVVIFVSPQYKESANCRTEAKYAKQRQLSSPLKIFYVMMCENYHTRSNPPVDGWLALNIGTELWYPLWNASMVNSTAQALSDLIGSGGGGGGGGGGGSHVSVHVPTTPSASASASAAASTPSSGGLDWDFAWSLISDPDNAIDVGVLTKALKDLGVSDKSDLSDLEKADLSDLVELLKKGKRKKFSAAVGV